MVDSLKKMIASKQTSTRLRCLLQDVVELHEAHWVPRHEENAPKTIDQVRREAEAEERERRLYEDLKARVRRQSTVFTRTVGISLFAMRKMMSS